MPEKESAKDTLRGRPFIGKSVSYVERFSGLYEDTASVIVHVQRECGNCFYRTLDDSMDCLHTGEHRSVRVDKDGKSWRDTTTIEGSVVIEEEVQPSAKKTFGFKEEDYLPQQLKDKEIGNYCPHFIHERLRTRMVKMGGQWLTPLIGYY